MHFAQAPAVGIMELVDTFVCPGVSVVLWLSCLELPVTIGRKVYFLRWCIWKDVSKLMEVIP